MLLSDPSPWVTRWSTLFAPGTSVLDLAAGSGRHTTWLATRGFRVTALDRDAESMRGLEAIAEVVVADLEGAPWPLEGRRFGAIVVTNYLWRPLVPTVVAALADGGVLVYETFAAGQETVGRPTRPDFLLRRGELLELTTGLRTVAFQDGFLDAPERFVQRIVAVREPRAALPHRYPLDGRPASPAR